MDEKTKSKLKQYEGLKLEQRILERKIKNLQQEIIPCLDPDATIETEDGTITVEHRNTWEYSSELQKEEEKLNNSKRRARAEGTATKIEGELYLVYREKKME